MTRRKEQQRVKPVARPFDVFSFTQVGTAESATETRRRELASWFLDSHDSRRALFPSPAFFDPSSDVLLRAFVAEGKGGCVSVSQLSQIVDLPRSTALRYIHVLVDDGMLVTTRSQGNHESCLELTRRARSTLEAWLDKIDKDLPPTNPGGC
jgi:predicted transcriptional regulator